MNGVFCLRSGPVKTSPSSIQNFGSKILPTCESILARNDKLRVTLREWNFNVGQLGACARDRAWERGKQVAQNLKANVGEKVATATENIVGDSIKQAATTPPIEPIGRV